MELPDSRALLGVDVIASASQPGYYRERQWGALSAMLGGALTASGITPADVATFEPTGDGALYSFPSRHLGTVVDLCERIDELAAEHNRWTKPEIRLRLSVEVGAVGDGPGYFTPKIHLARMLGAPAFKALLADCLRTDGTLVNSGLIVSGSAYREVFGGDYTALVQETDFVQLAVSDKEFSESAWVRVPGLDRHTLAQRAAAVPTERGPAREGPIHVTNHVAGNMTDSVQAGVIHGDVRLGRRP